MPRQPKVKRIDDSAFFVLGDYTLNIIDYQHYWAQTLPDLTEPFEEVPEIEEVDDDTFTKDDFVRTLRKVARPEEAPPDEASSET